MTDYNIGELRDLIAAKDADTAGDYASYQNIAQTWAGADPAAAAAWLTAWQTMIGAYQSARSSAETAIDEADALSLGITSAGNLYDATGSYQAILTALNPGALTNTVAPGSFDDLDGRLRAAGQTLGSAIPANVIPQPVNPTSGQDPNSIDGYLTGLGYKLGLVKNPPPATPGTPDGKPLIPTWLEVAAVCAVGAFVVSQVTAVGDMVASLVGKRPSP